MNEVIKTADKLITSMNVDFSNPRPLELPGGEITVWPKKIGLVESVKAQANFLFGKLLIDLYYPNNDRNFKLMSLRHYYYCFYNPQIPEALWYEQVRSTSEIQMDEWLASQPNQFGAIREYINPFDLH